MGVKLLSMTMSLIFMLVSLVQGFYHTSYPCIYEECFCSYGNIDCSARHLKALPAPKHGNFTQTSLDISNNSITTLPPDALPRKLTGLKCQHTPLQDIADGALSRSIYTLHNLDMQDTKMSRFPAEIKTLTKVTILNWSGNAVNDSAHVTSILTPLHQLAYLYLRDNQLTSIPDFSHNRKLEHLEIGQNLITDAQIVSLPSSLKFLELPWNFLTHIPRQFVRLTNLMVLGMRNNNITNIDSFVFPSSLSTLDLQSNKLENITSISFAQNKSAMFYLYLDGNPLKYISKTAFAQMPRIQTLYLFDTQLTRLPLALLSLKEVTYVGLNAIPGLVCTCEEAALATWRRNNRWLHVYGACTGNVTVDYFLTQLAPSCPPNV